jgi:hypothetical protein
LRILNIYGRVGESLFDNVLEFAEVSGIYSPRVEFAEVSGIYSPHDVLTTCY